MCKRSYSDSCFVNKYPPLMLSTLRCGKGKKYCHLDGTQCDATTSNRPQLPLEGYYHSTATAFFSRPPG